jgi:O-antigen biosynthesis protein WbqP
MQSKSVTETPQTYSVPPNLGWKRATDVVLSAGALLVFSPFLLLIVVAIKLDSRGPALFKQQRVGKDGELFEILKFRTMRTGTPNVATELIQKMGISPVTRVGNVLRRTSLDELPQLINVLRGDMSIVGPRPALFNQYDLTEMRRRVGALRMLPGITGWAQVNGRDDLADDVKVELDRWYCDNWRYGLDWEIIGKTFSIVISGRGGN